MFEYECPICRASFKDSEEAKEHVDQHSYSDLKTYLTAKLGFPFLVIPERLVQED